MKRLLLFSFLFVTVHRQIFAQALSFEDATIGTAVILKHTDHFETKMAIQNLDSHCLVTEGAQGIVTDQYIYNEFWEAPPLGMVPQVFYGHYVHSNWQRMTNGVKLIDNSCQNMEEVRGVSIPSYYEPLIKNKSAYDITDGEDFGLTNSAKNRSFRELYQKYHSELTKEACVAIEQTGEVTYITRYVHYETRKREPPSEVMQIKKDVRRVVVTFDNNPSCVFTVEDYFFGFLWKTGTLIKSTGDIIGKITHRNVQVYPYRMQEIIGGIYIKNARFFWIQYVTGGFYLEKM